MKYKIFKMLAIVLTVFLINTSLTFANENTLLAADDNEDTNTEPTQVTQVQENTESTTQASEEKSKEINDEENDVYAVTYHYVEMLENGTEKEVGTGTIKDVHYDIGLTANNVKTIKNNVPQNYRWDTGTDNLEIGDAAKGKADVKAYVNASTTERLYVKVIVDGVNKGTTLIYEGEPGNGASLSTKYAQDTSICDRIGPHGGECDVHASLNNGIVTFDWIHHSDSSGHNPKRMSKEFQLVADGIKIKASGFSDGVTVSSQESSTDQYDVHTFTINIDLSKMTNVIVHYVDKEDNEIADPETLTSYENDPFNRNDITILEIDGYENPTVGEFPDTYPAIGSTDVYVVYEKEKKFSVTYTDGVDGEEVFKDQVTTNLKKDAKTPDFDGTPEREGYIFNGWAPEVAPEVTKDAIYVAQWTPIQVSVIIHYVDEDGNTVVKDYADTVKYGDNISQDSPLLEGYELVNEEDRTVVKENITEDFEYNVIYKLKEFTITIHYIDEDGNPLAADFTSKVKYGGDFSQNSPNITGYELVNKEDITVGQTSIIEDFEYAVVYKKIPVPVPTLDPDNPKAKPDKEWFGMGDGIVQTGDMGAPEIAALAGLGALILALLIFFYGRKKE